MGKNMSYFDTLTQEQREENLRLGRIAREKKVEDWKSKAYLLQREFKDKPYWRKLASKHGVKMPANYVPGTELKLVRRAMKRSGVTPEQVKEAFGGDVKHLQAMNPTWPCFALIGLILELAEEK